MWNTGLSYFQVTASLGSMRLASEQLGIAVSSISRQIAQLEEEVGMPLFERGRRSIKLTEAGELLLEYAREQVAGKDALLGRFRDLQEVRSGHVVLAIGEGFLGNTFTSIFDRFQRLNAGIALTIVTASTSEIERMIVEDEAHLGMILHASSEPRIRNRVSVLQPLMVMCAPTHAVAQLESLSLEDLKRFDLCLPPKGFRIRRILNEAERHAGVWLSPKLTTTSILVMRESAKLGSMVTVLPRISALSEIGDGTLVARPLRSAELEHTTVSLVHRVGRRLDGAPLRMLALLEGTLRAVADVG